MDLQRAQFLETIKYADGVASKIARQRQALVSRVRMQRAQVAERADDVMRDDDQERAMVLASMNLWSNVVNSWWSSVLYPATDAPRFKKGNDRFDLCSSGNGYHHSCDTSSRRSGEKKI
ncbi:unnamed protein product [Tilletia caries]|uniref:Uncharacterized protein n=3 Tax=Tilletia TaxID=13289 RepID=A0A8X7MJ36_9BASI|nr:hypothetical protein CF336_g9736 [Tilletia laevis]KAE8179153.1 hypothetical protein CF328_g9576 [Tilletia controversa]CAD6959162.1 unnamed protein product [Tilletia caries]KAE8179260.1 hypothetical protein CF335_g9659 [Tilletia laevis]KAE8237123.1 hypothetical protein A4X06_0g9331 [Tilletia controversa]